MTHPAPPTSPKMDHNDESDGRNDDEDEWNVNKESEDSDDGGCLDINQTSDGLTIRRWGKR